MPRQKRADEAGAIYHALNRGNARQTIFHKAGDYQAFLRVLEAGLQRYSVELFAFVLMPNHWHLVIRPGIDGEMGRMLRWVTATHTQRHHAHFGTAGEGHLYQSRFKSFPVADDEHFLVVCRYVERNPLRAKLVTQAQDWPHCSLAHWLKPAAQHIALLSPWPLRRTAEWVARVNAALTSNELESVRLCVERGRPFGDADWVNEVAERNNLGYTLRRRGRPKKGE